MALTDEGSGNGFYMPVAPAYQGGGNSGFGNGFGGDWAWIILLLLLGWGNNGWGNGANAGGYAGGGALYPWMNQAEITTGGFRDQMLNDNITSIRDGVQGLSTQLCNCCGDMQMSLANGFAGTAAAITGAQSAISNQLYSNEIASLNRSFAEQTANTAGFNGVQSSLCDIRYGNASNTRDVIESQTRGTQAILDKLCQLELDGVKAQVEAKNDRIAELQSQLSAANLAASQTAQNAFIAQGFANEVDALYNRLSNCPVPTTPVYGRTPIFTCNNNCGCGCGSSFAN